MEIDSILIFLGQFQLAVGHEDITNIEQIRDDIFLITEKNEETQKSKCYKIQLKAPYMIMGKDENVPQI